MNPVPNEKWLGLTICMRTNDLPRTSRTLRYRAITHQARHSIGRTTTGDYKLMSSNLLRTTTRTPVTSNDLSNVPKGSGLHAQIGAERLAPTRTIRVDLRTKEPAERQTSSNRTSCQIEIKRGQSAVLCWTEQHVDRTRRTTCLSRVTPGPFGPSTRTELV
jgi:hypothetical protein